MARYQWAAVLFHAVVVLGMVFVLQLLNTHDRAIVTNFISRWFGPAMFVLLTMMVVRGFFVYRRAVRNNRLS